MTFYRFEILVYAASLDDEFTAKGLVYASSYADAVAKLEKDYTYHDKDGSGEFEMTIEEICHLEAYLQRISVLYCEELFQKSNLLFLEVLFHALCCHIYQVLCHSDCWN